LALSDLKEMAFEEIGSDLQTDQQILRWAERIGQMVIYDATYLTVAEQLKAEFWTADRRLANAARKAGATWTYFLGE
jgi:predicted nucleic acid-binding protein